MSKQGLAKAAGIVAFLTVVSKILGFFRETSLAAVFGATADVDAYLVAQTIPLLLFSIVSYALATTFIPIYSQVREESGRAGAFRFANTVMVLVFLLGLFLVATGEIWAEVLVGLVAPGFNEQLTELTAYLSRIIFPMMLFQLLSGIMTGILEADQNFSVPTAATLIQNVAIITATVLFGRKYGITAVAIGALLGAGISTAVKIPAIRRLGFRWSWTFDLSEPAVRRMFLLMLPAVVGAGATQLNVFVDRILASGLPEGRIASLNYANKLMELAPGILGASIITVVYPTLSKMVARKDWSGFAERTVDALSLIYFLLAPIAVGVLVLREPLVRIVFERGVFDSIATQETAWALAFLSLGIGITSMRRLTSRAFFAMQDTTTPMILGFVTVGLNIVLNLLLVGPLEQGGLALGTTLATLASLILGLWVFRRKSPAGLPIKRLINSILRIALASLIMGGVVWIIYPRIADLISFPGKFGDLASVTIAATVGGLFYLALAWFMKVPELMHVREIVTRVLDKILGQNTAKGL